MGEGTDVELRLVNMMQWLVQQELDSVLKHYPNLCRCERCMLDIQAIALNSLSPHYVVSREGELLVKAEHLSFQRQADIHVALTKAIEIVQQRPRHGFQAAQSTEQSPEQRS